MTRQTKLILSSLTVGLLALGGTSAAHATQCSVGSSSVLHDSQLLSHSESGHGTCGGDDSNSGDEGGWQGDDNPPSGHHGDPKDEDEQGGWHDPHDGKDCNPSVVPLPPSSLLLASGLIALLALGRRRRLATA